jgi:hypothetical protein
MALSIEPWRVLIYSPLVIGLSRQRTRTPIPQNLAQLPTTDTGRTGGDADQPGKMVPSVFGRVAQRILGGQGGVSNY